ncbi:MAG: TVP38/TMEM64 family protein [Candidatus Hydrogenedentes bacterium]|nr:TVP38/TMEM64 family protein [Candidatus Hydrogenedentota bacterium]
MLLFEVTALLERLGAWGLVLLAIFYVAACILLIPGSILTMGAGALAASLWPENLLWALLMGTAAVSAGSTAGAVAAFLLGRTLARARVVLWVSNNARFAALDAAIGADGWKLVFLLRLSPAFPFTLLNYALGLSSVSLRDYFFASWAGMLPGALLYVYIGATAQSLLLATAADRTRTPGDMVLMVLGLAAAFAGVFYVTRVARRALQAQTAGQAGEQE